MILELNSKGCVGVAKLKKDQQEQKPRDEEGLELSRNTEGAEVLTEAVNKECRRLRACTSNADRLQRTV